MSTRPATYFDDLGDRHYRHPDDYHRTWAGVSAILGTRRLEFLERARRKAIAEYAARHRKRLADVSRAPEVVAELLDESNTLPEWGRKRDAGTDAHDRIDRAIQFELNPGTMPHPADNIPAADLWALEHWYDFQLQTGFRPIDSERTVVNDRYGYAGSYDLYGALPDGRRCLVDVKTNEKGPKDDVALQLEFYHRAESIMDTRTGDMSPMHAVDAHYVLWIRPDGWAWIPVESGDRVWRYCYGRMLTYFSHYTGEVIGPKEAGNIEPPRSWFS